jgi:hypothetical protein
VPAPSSLATALPPSKRHELGIDDPSVLSSPTPSSDLGIGIDVEFDVDLDCGFSLHHLIGAIQNGEACHFVRAYLTHFRQTLGPETLKDRLNDTLDGCPGIFFVVETGNVEMVKLWVTYAGVADHSFRNIPLLGFAIARCQSFRKDMPMVVKILLSLGLSVSVIPRGFYEPLHRDLRDDGPSEDELDDRGEPAKSCAWLLFEHRLPGSSTSASPFDMFSTSDRGNSRFQAQTRLLPGFTRRVSCLGFGTFLSGKVWHQVF